MHAGFTVVPFAARLKEPKEYALAVDEVAEAFEIPVNELLNDVKWGCRDTKHPRARFRRVPYFEWQPHTVWGLTGIILRDFVTQVMGHAPPV